MLDFMEKFDPIQIRYGGTDFRHLIELVARTAQAAAKVCSLSYGTSSTARSADFAQPLIAIFPISSAILRLDPSGSCFTSSHLTFARLCLEAREYYAAVPVLNKDIYHFPLSSDKGGVQINPRFWCSHHEQYSTFITNASGLSEKLDYRDHLQYFLFGAMIYIGLKDWERASLFLEVVIISPASTTTSMIQVEAYKKWVLVSLLLKGRVSNITFSSDLDQWQNTHLNLSLYRFRKLRVLTQRKLMLLWPKHTILLQKSSEKE